MISGFIRNLVRCFWWLALTLVAIVATVWAVIEHYLNAANGLELAGTETKPLREDSLIGPVFEAFIPEATLPQAMALTIAVVEALGLFMMAHWLLKILELARPWRDGRRSGDQAKVREAIWQIGETSLLFAVLSGVLIWGIWWDLEIFRYRSMAGADGLDNAATAPPRFPVGRCNCRNTEDGRQSSWSRQGHGGTCPSRPWAVSWSSCAWIGWTTPLHG